MRLVGQPGMGNPIRREGMDKDWEERDWLITIVWIYLRIFKVLYGVYGSFISAGAAEGRVAHPYLINDNNMDRILYYAKSFAYEYSGVIKGINDIPHGKGVSRETNKPPIGGRGLYKGKDALA